MRHLVLLLILTCKAFAEPPVDIFIDNDEAKRIQKREQGIAFSVSIRPTDGAILLEGKPFFPLGMYHSSHLPTDDAGRLKDLEAVAGNGFNTFATPLNLTNGPPFLDKASQLGMYVLVENNDPNGLYVLSGALAGKPGLLGYQIVDDVDNGKKTVEQVLAIHQKVKQIDPLRLTYVSAGTLNAKPFIPTADLFAMQSYPIPFELPSSTYNLLKPLVDAAASQKRIVIANCQAFAWNTTIDGVKGRLPTPAEFKCLSYAAICAGAKGIIWYAFFDRTNYLPKDPALWAAAQATAREISSLNFVWLDGVRHPLTIRESTFVKATGWSHQGRVYLVVVNTSPTQTIKINAVLPNELTKDLRAKSGGLTGWTLHRTLAGEIKPLEVRIFTALGG